MNCWLVKNVIKRWSSFQRIRYQDVVSRSVSSFLNNFFSSFFFWGGVVFWIPSLPQPTVWKNTSIWNGSNPSWIKICLFFNKQQFFKEFFSKILISKNICDRRTLLKIKSFSKILISKNICDRRTFLKIKSKSYKYVYFVTRSADRRLVWFCSGAIETTYTNPWNPLHVHFLCNFLWHLSLYAFILTNL